MNNTMKVYRNGKLVKIVKRTRISDYAKVTSSYSPKRVSRRVGKRGIGSNQYRTKSRFNFRAFFAAIFLITVFTSVSYQGLKVYASPQLISPVPENEFIKDEKTKEVKIEDVIITSTPTPTATPTPVQTDLEKIVAYIAKKFEPEGKQVVVRAINCFYSESGLRADAVGHNKDKVRSTDYGVAQLNDYWHSLSWEQKTDYQANIDKAYEIYKGRGNFSAWYGKLCNN